MIVEPGEGGSRPDASGEGRPSSKRAMKATIVGSKAGAGVAERIVSELPRHTLYVEAFAGHAAVGRLKRAAALDVFIEKDLHTAEGLATLLGPHVEPIEGARWPAGPPLLPWSILRAEGHGRSPIVIRGDCMSVLHRAGLPRDAVVYCDPPYLSSVRRRPRRYYRCELELEAEHDAFLTWAIALPCRVLVSGYNSPLYAARLQGWRRLDFGAGTRGGRAIESLWCNFPPPAELHDTRFVGAGFRERERIRRKVARWARKLRALPLAERAAILEALTVNSDEPAGSSQLARGSRHA